MFHGDTIAAISSSAGPAARMVVRLSGPAAIAIAQALLCDDRGLAQERSAARRAIIGFAGMTLPVWLYLFVAPHSYTGENVVEFHIPGNALVARMLLGELLRRGARQAEAGEFTARAYFSGRMALDQAEGVAAIIASRGEDELSAARQLLAGELARALRPITDALGETLALVEAGMDFAEEDIAFLKPDELRRRIDSVRSMLKDVLERSGRFERLSHEPHFVLAGRPNAGKSTLLNALCGSERAVVSPVAGTTRDVIWAEAALMRGLVRIVDAAGLAENPPDEHDSSPAAHVARQMHRNALRAMAEADFVVLVHDLADGRPPLALSCRPDLVILSKADLRDSSAGRPTPDDGVPALAVSALTGAGMDLLRRRMDELAFGGRSAQAARLALNARHLEHINAAMDALAEAMDTAGSDESPEITALFLRRALDALGGVVGRITPEDLLQRIFATFCIGK